MSTRLDFSLCVPRTFVTVSANPVHATTAASAIVSFFISDESVIEMGITTLHALMCSTPLLGIMFVFSFSFQGMGKGKEALTIAISRQGFIFLPCVILLNKFFQLRGLIYSQPIADIVSVAMSFVIFLHINKELKTQEKAAAQ